MGGVVRVRNLGTDAADRTARRRVGRQARLGSSRGDEGWSRQREAASGGVAGGVDWGVGRVGAVAAGP